LGDESDLERTPATVGQLEHEVHCGVSAIGVELSGVGAQSVAYEMSGDVLRSAGQLAHYPILGHRRRDLG
jgi:hypothetical protein